MGPVACGLSDGRQQAATGSPGPSGPKTCWKRCRQPPTARHHQASNHGKLEEAESETKRFKEDCKLLGRMCYPVYMNAIADRGCCSVRVRAESNWRVVPRLARREESPRPAERPRQSLHLSLAGGLQPKEGLHPRAHQLPRESPSRPPPTPNPLFRQHIPPGPLSRQRERRRPTWSSP